MINEKITANIGFEKKIWDAACVLRGNMDASEYKSVVLGLIFLKYISDRFDEKYEQLKAEGDGFEEDIDEYTSEGIFFVPQGARWRDIAAKAHTPEIGVVIDDTTQIPVSLWFLSKTKKQPGKTLFIDARKMGTMVTRKLRELSEEDIKKIADTYNAFIDGTLEDIKGFCAVKTTDDIAAQDYILTPGRYVGIEDKEEDDEPFDEKMTRLTSELSQMFTKSHELEEEIRKKLGAIGYDI